MVPPLLLPAPADPEAPAELVLPAAPAPEFVEVEVPLVPAAPLGGVTVAAMPAAALPAAPEGVTPLLLVVPAAVGGIDVVALAPAAPDVPDVAAGAAPPDAPKGDAEAGGTIVRVLPSDPQPDMKAIATNAAAAMPNPHP